MKQKLCSLVVCLLLFSVLTADDIRMLYQKNHVPCQSQYEEQIVEHVKSGFEKAMRLESKLSGKQFVEAPEAKVWRNKALPNYHSLNDITLHAGYHLLNNLCNLSGATHLHVGLLAGDSFIAALYGNQSELALQVGVDWFMECSAKNFQSNCNLYLDQSKFQILDGECFKIDKALFEKPIDIYFYDADHCLKAHESALTYYNDVLADVFVVMIDDWSRAWIRGPTFKAFDKLGYSILYENVVMDLSSDDNGQYVAVIRKSDNSPSNESSEEIMLNYEFAVLKNKIFEKNANSWCSMEKANLIMELIYQTRPKICVEIGAYSGSSFLPIVSTLKLLKHGHAYGIDAWSNDEAIKGMPQSDPNYAWWSSVDMKKVLGSFLNTLEDWALVPYCAPIYAASRDAVSLFKCIDFLHFDGNSSEEGALEDVRLYLSKVPSGGYILLSNVFVVIDNKLTKMKALGELLESCEIIAEVDNSQTVLFRKL